MEENADYLLEKQLELGKAMMDHGNAIRNAILPSYFAAQKIIELSKEKSPLLNLLSRNYIFKNLGKIMLIQNNLTAAYASAQTESAMGYEMRICEIFDSAKIRVLPAVHIAEEMKKTLDSRLSQAPSLFIEPIERTNKRLRIFLENYPHYRAARDELITSAQGLVFKQLSEKFGGKDWSNGLIEKCWIGLIAAADKFDYKLGIKFSTYAYNGIALGLLSNDRKYSPNVVSVSRRLNSELTKLNEKLQIYDSDISDEELSKELKLSPKRIRYLRTFKHSINSLDAPIDGYSNSENGDSSWLEKIEDDKTELPDVQAHKNDLRANMPKVLACLDERSAKVVDLRFGLTSRVPQELEEIAQRFNVSYPMIQVILKRALKKLKNYKTRELLGAEEY
jgi:RNA polymerase primary sigma factor